MAAYISLPSYELLLVHCKRKSCLGLSEISSEIQTSGLTFTTYDGSSLKQHSLDLLSAVSNRAFVLIFYCNHLKSSLERILQKELNILAYKVIVITKTTEPLRNIGEFKRFTPREPTEIIRYILQKLDTAENDRYPPIDQIQSPKLPKRRPKRRQTQLKKLDPLPLDFKTLYNDVPDGFINLETFDNSDSCNRGIHVLQSISLPKVSACISVCEVKGKFNNANQEEREELSKQILSKTIKDLMKENDFLGLLYMLEIDDYRIQNSVFNAINNFLMQSSLYCRCMKENELLRSANYLIELCRKWSANHVVMTNLLPLNLDTVANLYLSSCVSGTSQSNIVPQIQTFVEDSIPIVDKIIDDSTELPNQSECGDLLLSLRKHLEDLKSVGKNPSPLQMGNFRDALMEDNSRSQLKMKFTKSMTYMEQYSFLQIVINQIFMKSDLRLVTLLKELAEILVDRVTKKPKCIHFVYALLRLITKGVVHRLCVGSLAPRTTSEYQLTLCKVLNVYTASTKIPLTARLRFLCLIEPLLFKETKDLVTNVVYLFSKNNQQAKDIRGKVSKHIVQKLSAINFKLDGVLQQPPNVGLEPSWVTMAGTVSEDKHVIVYVLIPTLHCIAEGSMTDYKHKANKCETRKHLNTMDILRHLQEGKSHHNLIELIAFQCRPLPIFYITDKSIDHDLNSYLLEARKIFHWISNRRLTTLVADAVDAVSYLHSKSVIHRNLTTFAFSLRRETNIVLHDFSAAKAMNNTGFLSDLDNSEMPVLWSAPESILEDHYDTKTDTWMVGQFIYEIFTHGCHPYTEVYGTATEQLLEYIVFQDLKPRKWPCIPKEVHDIIYRCVTTKPEERLDISAIGQRLNNLLDTFKEERRGHLSQIFEEDKKYPELDPKQKAPERGLPHLFQQLKKNNTQDRTVIRKSYFNTRNSQRRPLNKRQITEADIKSDDQPIIQEKHNFLAVYEPVTVDFVQSLPHLDRDLCINVLGIMDIPSREERNIPGNCQYLLKYRLQKSTNILEIAFKLHGDPEDSCNELLDIVLKLVKFVGEMHKRHWILRDLCADNIFLTHNHRQITMPRIGRMIWMDYHNILDDCIIDDVKENRKRWLPIEVLQNGQFSKCSDMYMVGMVIYEFYTALNVHNTDHMTDHLDCAPFSNIPMEDLLKTLYSGDVPLQPDYCPDWLYDILKRCWDRDPTRRPSTEQMEKEILENMRRHNSEDQNYDILENEQNEDYEPLQNENDENYDIVGEAADYDALDHTTNLVMQNQTKAMAVSTVASQSSRVSNSSDDISSRSINKKCARLSCMNSDTESENSALCQRHTLSTYHNVESSESENRSCNIIEFRCVNSESENEYYNDYQHTDGISRFGKLYQNTIYLSKQLNQTEKERTLDTNDFMVGGHNKANVSNNLKSPTDTQEKTNCDNCSNESYSSGSTTYFHVDTPNSTQKTDNASPATSETLRCKSNEGAMCESLPNPQIKKDGDTKRQKEKNTKNLIEKNRKQPDNEVSNGTISRQSSGYFCMDPTPCGVTYETSGISESICNPSADVHRNSRRISDNIPLTQLPIEQDGDEDESYKDFETSGNEHLFSPTRRAHVHNDFDSRRKQEENYLTVVYKI